MLHRYPSNVRLTLTAQASTARSALGPPRTIRLLPLLQYIHSTLFKYLFNKPADGLEKSTDAPDEYMVYDNDPLLTRSIEVPDEMSSLSCSAITAGIVEAVMDGWGFVSLYLVTLLMLALMVKHSQRE